MPKPTGSTVSSVALFRLSTDDAKTCQIYILAFNLSHIYEIRGFDISTKGGQCLVMAVLDIRDPKKIPSNEHKAVEAHKRNEVSKRNRPAEISMS